MYIRSLKTEDQIH
uniref:Uncharacterized protein n=1 Tax=Anguilla anguilla TaxID=7936 RepID=A0A0E9S4W4_ANGAN